MTTQKKTAFALLVAASFAMTGVAFAQEGTADTTATEGSAVTNTGTTQNRDAMRAAAEAKAAEMRRLAEQQRMGIEAKKGELQAMRASTTDMMQQKRGELEAKRASTTEMLQDKRAELGARIASTTERMQERRKQESLRYAKRMEERMAAAFDRLSKLADRIDERIAKITAANKNIKTDTAKARLVDARKKIEAGRTALTGLQGQVEAALASADPKTGFEGVRAATKVIEGDAKAAHQALVDAIKSLKANTPDRLENDDNGGAPTATTTAQ